MQDIWIEVDPMREAHRAGDTVHRSRAEHLVVIESGQHTGEVELTDQAIGEHDTQDPALENRDRRSVADDVLARSASLPFGQAKATETAKPVSCEVPDSGSTTSLGVRTFTLTPAFSAATDCAVPIGE